MYLSLIVLFSGKKKKLNQNKKKTFQKCNNNFQTYIHVIRKLAREKPELAIREVTILCSFDIGFLQFKTILCFRSKHLDREFQKIGNVFDW